LNYFPLHSTYYLFSICSLILNGVKIFKHVANLFKKKSPQKHTILDNFHRKLGLWSATALFFGRAKKMISLNLNAYTLVEKSASKSTEHCWFFLLIRMCWFGQRYTINCWFGCPNWHFSVHFEQESADFVENFHTFM